MHPEMKPSILHNLPRAGLWLLFIIWVGLISSCGPAPVVISTQAPSGRLTPYLSPTPRVVPAGPAAATPVFIPSPTPAPLVHVVKKGEDMGGIAYHYGIPLAALMAANPEVDPGLMSVGLSLVIPLSETVPPPPSPAGQAPSAITLGSVNCLPGSDASIRCFLMASNPLDTAVENPAAVVRILDRTSGETTTGRAEAPLNLLLPGGSMPMTVFFPPPAPLIFDAAAELVSAVPLTDPWQRYIPVQVEDPIIIIQTGGLAASVEGKVVISEGETGASSVWVVLAAVDPQGNVVGLRRWESSSPLDIGQKLAFGSTVYSAGGLISEVKIFVEARR